MAASGFLARAEKIFIGKLPLALLALILLPASIQAATPAIKERLDSWRGHTLSEVCDCWSLLPDKTLEIGPATKKVEFSYAIQVVENGAYIPGEEYGYFDYAKNVYVRTGTGLGTYQKVNVTYSCKVILTLENDLITTNSYSGDEKALQHFSMEPGQYASYLAEEEQKAKLARQNAKPGQDRDKKYFLDVGAGFSLPTGDLTVALGLFAPAVDFPVYPLLELCYVRGMFDKSRAGFGGQLLAAIGTGRPDPTADGDLYLASGIKLGFMDGGFSFGIPIRAGIRFPGNFEINSSVTLSPSAAADVNLSMLIFFGV